MIPDPGPTHYSHTIKSPAAAIELHIPGGIGLKFHTEHLALTSHL